MPRPVRYRITVREKAPGSPTKAAWKREEFQILPDGAWHHRFFPAAGDMEEIVVLTGGSVSRAAKAGSTFYDDGHGRNWAIEGPPGASFDIILDPKAQTVS